MWKERRYILLVTPALVIFIAFFIAPVLTVLRFSFGYYDPNVGLMDVFTLKNFFKLTEPFYLNTTVRTLAISLIVVVLCIIIGYPVGYFLARTRFRYKLLLTTVVLTPVVVGGVVRAYGWMVMLGSVGVINTTLIRLNIIQEPLRMMFTPLAVIVGLTHVLVVFMILSIMSVIRRIDPTLEYAAQDLGANRLQTFLRVTLPLSLPGLATGSAIVFALSMSSFVIPEFLGGDVVGMLGPEAQDQTLDLYDWPLGAAISTLLVLVTAVIMIAHDWFMHKQAVKEM